MKKHLFIIALCALGVYSCQNPESEKDELPISETAYTGPFPEVPGTPSCEYLIPYSCNLHTCQMPPCGCWRIGNPLPIPGQPDPGKSCRNLFLDDEQVGWVPAGASVIHNINNRPGFPKIDTIFTLSFMKDYLYMFRKGHQYINHYMNISNVLFNEGMDSMLILKIIDAAEKTIVVADKMMYAPNVVVMFDSSYRADMLSLISDLRPYNALDYSFHASLDSITLDLNRHVGQTRGEFYAYYAPSVE